MTNRLPFGIGDFLATFKGDTPGHPFRGNQYDGGAGGGASDTGESGSSAAAGDSGKKPQALPKPKILAGHEVSDSFTNKKGTALYTLQRPTDDSEKGWAIVKTVRRDKDKSAVHFYESTGKRDDVTRDFNEIKRFEG